MGAYNSIGEPDLPFVKTQWKFKQAFALDADRQSKNLLDKVLAPRDAGASSVDVFNTSSWPRTELVTLPKGITGNCVKDEQGRRLPSQQLHGGEVVFLARDIPPFSAKRFKISSLPDLGPVATALAQDATLKTSTLCVKLDAASGAIVSLKHAGIAAELAKGPINNYIYLPGGNVKDAQPSGPAKVSVKESGPLLASLVAESQRRAVNAWSARSA